MNKTVVGVADVVQEARAVRPLPPTPTTTVIITNWNYGHYLADCIESVLAQTLPVDEIIVVDDGSTDGSTAVLDTYADRATIHRQPNLGQAAAINAGFRASSGEIVFLLDADDLLRPDAIETVLTLWAPDLSALSFGLDLVDWAGRSRGLYEASLDADDGDNRPRLLSGADFTFAPTSGHAFSRAFLARVLPMPEARWRISADAFLVRAAALYGRMQVIRRVLGAYRLHGSNNYQREDLPRPSMHKRGMKDLADALAEIAELPKLPASSEAERALLRLRLALLAAKLSLGRLDPAETRRRWNRALSLAFHSAREFPLAAAAVAPLAAVRFGGMRSARIRRWVDDPRTRPEFVSWVLTLLGWERLQQRLGVLDRPRWTETIQFDKQLLMDAQGPQRNIFADGWHRRPGAAQWLSRSREAALEFALPPSPAPAWLELEIALGEEENEQPLRFTLESAGRRVFEGVLKESGTIDLQLARGEPMDAPIRLALRCEAQEPEALHRRLFRPNAHFSITRMRAYLKYAREFAPHLSVGSRVPFTGLMGAEPAQQGWRLEEDGSVSMAGTEATCAVSVAATDEPLELLITPAAAPSAGWLHIFCNDEEIFAGESISARELRIRLPALRTNAANLLALRFAYTPSDPGEEARFGIREIGLMPLRLWPLVYTNPAHEPSIYPRLNIGERVFTNDRLLGRVALLAGWDQPDENGVRNTSNEPALAFNIDADATDLQLKLDLSSLSLKAGAGRHVIGVSSGGALLTSVQFLGVGQIQVALPAEAVGTKGDVVVAIHSVFLPEAADPGKPATPVLGRLELQAVTISGRVEAPASTDPALDFDRESPLPEIARLTQIAAKALSQRAEVAAETREKLADVLWRLDERGHKSLLLDPSFLQSVNALSVATAGLPHSAEEQRLVEAMRKRACEDLSSGDRLRIVLVSMLLLPACRAPLKPDLAAVPPELLYDSWRTAAYLGRDPALIEDEGERDELLRHLKALLASVEATLASERLESPRYLLAARTLQSLMLNKVMFGDHNLASFARLKGRVTKRYLAGRGAVLALTRRAARSDKRIRVGVLVRDVVPSPEAWLLFGMYRNLDRDRFELVLIRLAESEASLDPGSLFKRQLLLSGLSVEESVEAIRRLGLDIFVLGAGFNGYEKLMAIVAHRLAPLQVMTTAIQPLTTGLRSFDVALSSPSTEPPDAEAHYTEKLVFVPGPFQCFDFSTVAAEPGDRNETRAQFHIPQDAVVLVSGAMMHKIGPDLMRAWTRILQETTGSVLVLYPFARIWLMSYPVSRFLDRFHAMLAAAEVDAKRLIIIDEQPHATIRRILRASDIYLDSFPFSGATTVVEAIVNCLPVVAMAGKTQRGLQGASWARTVGMRDLVAHSTDDYVAKAAALARDPAGRQAITERLNAVVNIRHPAFSDFATYGLELGRVLERLARERGGISDVAPIDVSAVREMEEDREGSCARRLDDPTSPYRYVFHHMPKAAGTSCRQVFGAWFTVHLDEPPPWAKESSQEPFAIDEFGPRDLLWGHFNIDSTRLPVRYPQIFADKRFRLITFIRDPLERALSNHFYQVTARANDPDFVAPTLSQRLRSEREAFADHFAFHADHWRRALDRYWFIGTVERMPECLAWLASYFGEEMPRIPVLNASDRPEQPDPIDVDIFRANNQLGYAIYREIDRRLDRLMGPRAGTSEGTQRSRDGAERSASRLKAQAL